MKRTPFFFVISCILALICLPAHTATDAEIRKELHNGARQELLSIGTKEIAPANVGDWRETIDSALFMLFRRTELFRGPLRIMIVEDATVFSRIYPEGIIVLSSGLLDYIDLQVFELTVNEPRRARDHANERERMLAPFLAYNAARFALDLDFRSFKRTAKEIGTSRAAGNISVSMLPSNSEIQQTDQLAKVLIKLAGYNPEHYDSLLNHMRKFSPIPGNSLSCWFDSPIEPSERRIFLEKNVEKTNDLTSAFSIILQTLRNGNAYQDAISAVTELRETMTSSMYLSRLEALMLHHYWLSTVQPEKQIMKTFFPFASVQDPSRELFIQLAKSKKNPTSSKSGTQPLKPEEGPSTIYNSALFAYETFLSAQVDPSFSSTQAMLLFQGRKDTNRALEIAESASRLESQDFVAKANYATLLFLSGKDTTEALRIMSRLLSSNRLFEDKKRISNLSSPLLLDIGIPGDERDLLINHAIMLNATKNRSSATKLLETLESWEGKKALNSKLLLRGISLGDTTSELINQWGHPESIAYNYYSETWQFPKLEVEVSLEQPVEGKDPRIARITLNQGSPVSPGGEIRTGDSRNDFEQTFGKPMYRSGDCEVYSVEGTRVTVLYLFERIRSITISN
ncbi:MAG TPA: hypothetical protein GXZ47_01825 [Treponema sp.]|nr:hypothetical protein [Treponema sp.]